MSFRGLLKHRCHVLRLVETSQDGSPVHAWEQVTDAEIRCFLDLTFVRHGKDPHWTPEAGRAADPSGVWFGLKDAPVRPGDRIKMVKGPAGVFEVDGAYDEAWRPTELHHIEVGVKKVPPPQANFGGA